MVAAVGEDFPGEHMDVLAGFRGIDTAGLEVRRGSKTFRWTGKYMENMDHRESLETQLNVLMEAPPPVPEQFRDSKFVFLANMHPAAARQGCWRTFPSGRWRWRTRWICGSTARGPDLNKLLGQIDGLVLNYDEAELLTGSGIRSRRRGAFWSAGRDSWW